MIKSLKLGTEQQVLGTPETLGSLRKLPKPFTHSTLNTVRVCKICRGTRMNVIIHSDNKVRQHHCIRCHGTGLVHN